MVLEAVLVVAMLVATAIVHRTTTAHLVVHMQEVYPSRHRHALRHHHAVLPVVALTAPTARFWVIRILTGMLIAECVLFPGRTIFSNPFLSL